MSSSSLAVASDSEPTLRVWIDTDAACGHRATADPDDCFALWMLTKAPQVVVAGVSTVFGNAPLADTDRIVRRVLERSKRGDLPPRVHRGFAHAFEEVTPEPMPGGVLAIREALREGPLRIVALGPLSNIAAAIHDHPALARNIVEVVAVMGKREGHLFHPSEGARLNLLFGHGPIFSDVNFSRDVLAARMVMRSGVRITLLPYELARQVSLTGGDLSRFERMGGTLGWIARSSRGWLAYWRAIVGRDGFYPFDLLAAVYTIDDRHVGCAREPARVAVDGKVGPFFRGSASLLVGAPHSGDDRAFGPAVDVTYCTVAHPSLRPWLLATLVDARSGFTRKRRHALSWAVRLPRRERNQRILLRLRPR
jgi:purine nucleosidase